jgi:hypothetical protein
MYQPVYLVCSSVNSTNESPDFTILPEASLVELQTGKSKAASGRLCCYDG